MEIESIEVFKIDNGNYPTELVWFLAQGYTYDQMEREVSVLAEKLRSQNRFFNKSKSLPGGYANRNVGCIMSTPGYISDENHEIHLVLSKTEISKLAESFLGADDLVRIFRKRSADLELANLIR